MVFLLLVVETSHWDSMDVKRVVLMSKIENYKIRGAQEQDVKKRRTKERKNVTLK